MIDIKEIMPFAFLKMDINKRSYEIIKKVYFHHLTLKFLKLEWRNKKCLTIKT